jgi:cytoskeletal protein RodZ
MSHAVPPADGRRSRLPILGAILVVFGVVLAVVAVVALNKPQGQSSPTGTRHTSGTGVPTANTGSASTSTSPPSSTSPAATPTDTISAASSPAAGTTEPSVAILNNTQVAGLAATAAADLRAGGWTVTSTDNYANNIVSTCAYYDPSDPANKAAALDMQKQYPWIRRVVARFPELPASPIVLVITAAY